MICINILTYIQVILMIGTIDYLWNIACWMILLMAVNSVCCLLASSLFINIYVKLFPAYKVLQINGDYENYLSQKIRDRDDKYQISEEISVYEPWEKLLDMMAKYDTILLNDIPSAYKNKILKYCFDNSIRVYFTPKISDIIVKGTEVINLFDSPLLLCKNIGLNFEQRLIKRCMDLVISGLGIILTSPIMLLTAVCIKCNDGGPVFYKQDRCTLNGKVFTIYKFRSMIVDAEKDGKIRPATEDDDRITKVGKIIRKTRVDELPQLINIIKGEMSFIGPRPFLINDLGTYSKEQLIRFDVLPGMSSWTSIHGRANQSIESKYNHEIYYVNNISLKLDMEIFIKTVALVFSQKDVEDHVTEGRIAAEIIEDKK